MMHWQRWLAAVFIVLALTGCAEVTTGHAGTPYPREDNGIKPERGGGDGGGGGAGM